MPLDGIAAKQQEIMQQLISASVSITSLSAQLDNLDMIIGQPSIPAEKLKELKVERQRIVDAMSTAQAEMERLSIKIRQLGR
jgi:hypothetical protein